MTIDEIKPWVEKRVIVTLDNGSLHSGTLLDTPEAGLYHLIRTPSRPGVIETSGPLVDLYANEIVRIEAAN